MDEQLKKGMLDAFVLAFVKRNDTYGYLIVEKLSEHIEMSESTLYPILRRLCDNGFLSTYNLVHNGRTRKYYSITPSGENRLKIYKQDFNKLKVIFDTLMFRANKSKKKT